MSWVGVQLPMPEDGQGQELVPGVCGSGQDLHIHIIPAAHEKSSVCGGAVAVALASLITGCRVKPGIVVVGEMTLTGELSRVSGIGKSC